MTNNSRVIQLLLAAEEEINELQNISADRQRAVVLTHIQTAILWLHKPYVDDLVKSDTISKE